MTPEQRKQTDEAMRASDDTIIEVVGCYTERVSRTLLRNNTKWTSLHNHYYRIKKDPEPWGMKEWQEYHVEVGVVSVDGITYAILMVDGDKVTVDGCGEYPFHSAAVLLTHPDGKTKFYK